MEPKWIQHWRDFVVYNIAMNVMNDNEDQEPMIIEDCTCRQRNDWPKWKDAIEA